MTEKTEQTPSKALRAAATVVLIRDAKQGVETLLLKRNKALFAGGAWVFPGGAIDPQDIDECGGDLEQAARFAAVREAEEEAGLSLEQNTLIPISHWTTPEAEPKRFATAFFVAPYTEQAEVQIDGGEIHEAQWIVIKDALSQHQSGSLGLFPPTYMTLLYLSKFSIVAKALDCVAGFEPFKVLPVLSLIDDEVVILLAGDAGYDQADARIAGERHRVVLEEGAWRYLHETKQVARFDGP